MPTAPYITNDVGLTWVEFAALKGRVAPIAASVEDFSRPGINGHGLKQQGTRGQHSQITTVTDFATIILAATHIAACVAYQGGDLATIYYADGTNASNVAVLNVIPSPPHQSPLTVGGLSDGPWIVRLAWTVHQAE